MVTEQTAIGYYSVLTRALQFSLPLLVCMLLFLESEGLKPQSIRIATGPNICSNSKQQLQFYLLPPLSWQERAKHSHMMQTHIIHRTRTHSCYINHSYTESSIVMGSSEHVTAVTVAGPAAVATEFACPTHLCHQNRLSDCTLWCTIYLI